MALILQRHKQRSCEPNQINNHSCFLLLCVAKLLALFFVALRAHSLELSASLEQVSNLFCELGLKGGSLTGGSLTG